MNRPLVAILRGITPDEIIAAGEVLVAAGITMIEVPLNSPEPFESIRRLVDASESHITIGAGRLGADVLKLFPGALLGTDGLKAIRAVLPAATQVYAVGGAGPENFDQWLQAGANGFGLGSALYRAGDSMEILAGNAQRIVTAYDAAYQSGQ